MIEAASECVAESSKSVIDATRTALDLSSEVAAPWKGGQRVKIELAMQAQCHSNWCWAAVAASVARYYDPNDTVRQCEIANLELQRVDCCLYPCDAKGVDFNVTNVFASPLRRVGCLRYLARFQRAEPSRILEELKAGRPVCVRTVWRDGGAHFLAIVGYWTDPDDTTILTLDDPFWGRSEYDYDQFAEHYQLLGGTWNDTYYTRSPS